VENTGDPNRMWVEELTDHPLFSLIYRTIQELAEELNEDFIA
jgi:hypothetical protein